MHGIIEKPLDVSNASKYIIISIGFQTTASGGGGGRNEVHDKRSEDFAQGGEDRDEKKF